MILSCVVNYAVGEVWEKGGGEVSFVQGGNGKRGSCQSRPGG